MNHPPSGESRPTYHGEHFEPLFAVEDRHFWFRSRNRCIGAATHLIPNRDSIKNIVEHGCGTGFVLAELQRLFPKARVVGTDLFAEGLAFARRRFAGELIQTDLFQWKTSEKFNLVGFFDVLEHLDDDLLVLRALREQLNPSGHLLLTVPAHMSLWCDYDVASGHRRRYSRAGLESRLREAGFEVKYCTGFMSVLFPLLWVRRRLLGGGKAAQNISVTAASRVEDELRINPLLNHLFDWVLRPESQLIRKGWHLPAGTSWLVLAKPA